MSPAIGWTPGSGPRRSPTCGWRAARTRPSACSSAGSTWTRPSPPARRRSPATVRPGPPSAASSSAPPVRPAPEVRFAPAHGGTPRSGKPLPRRCPTMNALTLLTADHNRVRGLFARFTEAQESDDHQAMEEIARAIFVELAVHTQIEEEIFYPAV